MLLIKKGQAAPAADALPPGDVLTPASSINIHMPD